MAPEDSYSQAEIVRTLRRIESGQAEMRSELKDQIGMTVSRDAWELKNQALDREIVGFREALAKVEHAAQRPSQAPVWIGTSLAIATSLIALINAVGT